jgi:hypothetical protein
MWDTETGEIFSRWRPQIVRRAFCIWRVQPGLLPVIATLEKVIDAEANPRLSAFFRGQQPFGVMIARGDLGVEMVEIQEEILWRCERHGHLGDGGAGMLCEQGYTLAPR